MLQRMRAKTQSFGSKIIVGAIILALSLFGFGFGAGALFDSGDDSVASVNGQEITPLELQRAVQQRKERLRDQYGDEVVDLLDDETLNPIVLSELVQRALLLGYTSDLGLSASTGEVDDTIVSDPAFELAGEFSPELFRQIVASAGFSPETYREEIGDGLRLNAFQQALLDSSFLSKGELRRLAQVSLQTRDLAWLEFDPDSYVAQFEIGEEALTTAYELRLAEFMTDTRIDAQYLEFRLEDMATSIDFEADESSLRAAYEEEISELEETEQRRASHILLSLDDSRSEQQGIEEAIALRDRVLAGESFEDLAQAYSDDPGSAAVGGALGTAGRGVYVAEFEEALWAMQEGEISQPVVTEFGVHIIRLDELSEIEVPSFEARRVELAQELRELAAMDRFAELKIEADDLAFDSQSSLEPLMERFDLTLGEEVGVTELQGGGVFAQPVLREALFAADVRDSGFNSPLIEVGDDVAYVVRASKVHVAEQIPFEEARDQLHQEMRQERATEFAVQAAEEAMAKLLEGAGASQVSDAQGAWQRRDAVRRDEAEIPAPVITTGFELPRPAAGERSMDVVALDAGVSALVVVSGVRDGDTSEVPESELQQIFDEIKAVAREREIGSLYAGLREAADIESPQLDGSP